MAPEAALTAQHAVGKKRPAKKRAPGLAAGKTKKRAAVAPRPGVVEAALAAFAHEVRTPLTGILAISDLLATSDLDERERRWVDTIKAGAEHLASLATLFVDAAQARPCAVPGCGRICSTCGRSRATPAICWPAGRRQRACNRRSNFGKTAVARGRRSRPAARRAGKPDRQCGEIHRCRASVALDGRADARAPKGKVGRQPSRSPTAASG